MEETKKKLAKIELQSEFLDKCVDGREKTEDWQRMILSEDGKVELAFYRRSKHGPIELKPESFYIEKEEIQEIFAQISNYFYEEYMDEFVLDENRWILDITKEDGNRDAFEGVLGNYFGAGATGLSALIREKLKRPDLFIFDGMPLLDEMQCIEFTYGKTETLCIDSKQGILEYTRILSEENQISTKITAKDQIRKLFDSLIEQRCFADVEDEDHPFMDESNMEPYSLTISYKSEKKTEITGCYHKHGLPEDYPLFIYELTKIMNLCFQGNIFSATQYTYVPPKKEEWIYCSVVFESGYKTYYYITNDTSIRVGDHVVVPAGRDDHESIVEVVDIEYFKENEVPFDISKTKHIIRKL